MTSHPAPLDCRAANTEQEQRNLDTVRVDGGAKAPGLYSHVSHTVACMHAVVTHIAVHACVVTRKCIHARMEGDFPPASTLQPVRRLHWIPSASPR